MANKNGRLQTRQRNEIALLRPRLDRCECHSPPIRLVLAHIMIPTAIDCGYPEDDIVRADQIPKPRPVVRTASWLRRRMHGWFNWAL